MSQSNDEFSYENILRKKKGLLDIKIKVSVRDSECLSMVYTPGVATPCLDIQKDITRAYELTNKGNAIIVLTDSSAITKEKVPNAKWNNNAAMPYLEAFSAYYKTIANIDAYPFILDANLIPDAEALVDTVNAISPSYAGVELFMVDPERMKKFNELFAKSDYNGKYAYVDSSSKKEIDALLKTKNTHLHSHAILAAIWRAALDTHTIHNHPDVLLPDLGQFLNSLQHIGRMPQGILDILGGGIAGPGKGAKGCHIGENPSSEAAGIIGDGLALNNLPCRLQKVAGKAEAGSKVVGGTGGNVSNRCLGACLEQSRNGLIKCTVTAAADNQVHLIAKPGNLTDSISGACGNIGLNRIVRTVKQCDDLCQHFCCFLLPGIGIHDQKHFFHGYFLSYCGPGSPGCYHVRIL